ncbi:MAG: hypothetical protein NC250_05300 [Alistipes senegalensis]|nr:hypothetical protein [Bacteroides cellulosilyticus]MCM1352127.1 hypothetical protein [Alistipes senegalensis]
MKILIARQPFVPAFLTLTFVTAAALWSAPAPDAASAEPVARVADMVGSGMAISMPGEMLLQFQYAFPTWARWATLFAALFAGMSIGRISVHTNLYGVSSCLTIPLFGIFACALAGGEASLMFFVTALLLASGVRLYCAAFRNGYSFDRMFRASFCLGLLVLIRPAALPLLLLLPFSILLFQRTLRESVVALAGLLLAPALLCYVNWAMGGTFVAPLVAVRNEFLGGMVFMFFRSADEIWLWTACAFVGLNVWGIGSIAAHFYSVGTRARYLLAYNIGVMVLCLSVLCGPAATTAETAWLAVPSAVLLPFLFVRMFPPFASMLYVLLLAATLALPYLPLVLPLV